jgi:MFS family permease
MNRFPAFFSGFVMLLIGCALAMGAAFGLPRCHGEIAMRCVWMLRAAAAAGFMVGITGILLQFSPRERAAGLQMANILNGLLITAIGGPVIGPCTDPAMACAEFSGTAVMLSGALITLVAAADCWRLSKKA